MIKSNQTIKLIKVVHGHMPWMKLEIGTILNATIIESGKALVVTTINEVPCHFLIDPEDFKRIDTDF